MVSMMNRCFRKTVEPLAAIQEDQEVRLNGLENSGREVINQVSEVNEKLATIEKSLKSSV